MKNRRVPDAFAAIQICTIAVATFLPAPANAAGDCVWGDTIGGDCFQVIYKDGGLAYYEGDFGEREAVEFYQSCPTKEESDDGFPGEVNDGFYPAGSGGKLCAMRAPCKSDKCPEDIAKAEVKRASEENKYRLPEKRLDREGMAAAVKDAVERAGVCPSGYEHRDTFDTHGNTFYLLGVHCIRKFGCREGFVRVRARVGSECRRYGSCPQTHPFGVSVNECGTCFNGGCPDLSRNPPMCVVNMRNPDNVSHCEEKQQEIATQYYREQILPRKQKAGKPAQKSDGDRKKSTPTSPSANDEHLKGQG